MYFKTPEADISCIYRVAPVKQRAESPHEAHKKPAVNHCHTANSYYICNRHNNAKDEDFSSINNLILYGNGNGQYSRAGKTCRTGWQIL